MAVFKAGGYLSVVFVPVFGVGFVIALSLADAGYVLSVSPETNATAAARELAAIRRAVLATPQVRAIRLLRTVGWAATGYLVLPVVQHMYGLDRKRSVAAVLPPTLVAIYVAAVM